MGDTNVMSFVFLIIIITTIFVCLPCNSMLKRKSFFIFLGVANVTAM